MFLPRYLSRKPEGSNLREPVLLHTGDVVVGARCMRPAASTAGWSLCASETETLRDLWSVVLESPCHSVVVNEDAGLVIAGEKERLRCYDLATGELRLRELNGYHVTAALSATRAISLENVPAVLADGTQLHQGTRVCELDLERGVVTAHFGLHDRVSRAPVDDSGTYLIACGERAALWHLPTRTPVLGFDASAAAPDLMFRPRGKRALRDGVIEVIKPYDFVMHGPLLLDVKVSALRVEITRLIDPRSEGRAPVMSAHASPDGRYLVTAHADHIDNHHIEGNAILIWDLDAKELVTEIAVHGERSPYQYAWGQRTLRGLYEEWRDRVLFDVAW